jgi:hypothetical protein
VNKEQSQNDTATCIPTARQRLGEHTSLTLEAVFSAWPMQITCQKLREFSRIIRLSELSRIGAEFWRWQFIEIEKKWQGRN